MRTTGFGVLVMGTVIAAAVASGSGTQNASGSHAVTKEQYEQWKKDLSNWGRWGKDDQLGAINLITAAKRKQAAALVKDGVSVSMALDADEVKAIDNPNPYEHRMLGIGSDYIGVAMHGWAHTHLDSLAHINDKGVFFNGYHPDPDQVKKDNGHARNSLYNEKNGIFTRGVLLDIVKLKGVKYLEPGTPIYMEDLEAAEKMEGVKVGQGDALFIRTGVWPYRKEHGPYARGRAGKDAGLDSSTLPWLKQRDIAILGSDHPQGVNPAPAESAVAPNAVHDFMLLYRGVLLFDNCDLEALATAAAERHRYDFLLTAAPLPVKGATGSEINPIATF
jgi:kynurenine formamidase